ncbi:MAG: phosphonate ABC transporter, permease protein PhnE [Elioraea sp.]|nr:phosphonate ABC transporter, permease protein PhnE [Elioraea sp.]
MPVIAKEDGRRVWTRRTTAGEFATWFAWLCGVALTVFCFQFLSQHTIWAFVWDAPRQAADLLERAVPPRWDYAHQLWKPMWDTINIATLGTLLAVLIAVPTAFLAAHNTTPSRLLLRPVALFVIVASRSVNSLIWALILVIIFGPGMFAGILAIGLRSIGFIGKLLYEAIEEIDPTQVEAIRATGASGAQVLAWGIVPQVLPAFAGISVFRWDINIREATVLGLVGAGGIGLQLQASIGRLAWEQVSMILLLILATVIVSEWVSARVRYAII